MGVTIDEATRMLVKDEVLKITTMIDSSESETEKAIFEFYESIKKETIDSLLKELKLLIMGDEGSTEK